MAQSPKIDGDGYYGGLKTSAFLSTLAASSRRFLDRNDDAARRRLKDLAVGTFAWYASEPTRELAWYDISEGRFEG